MARLPLSTITLIEKMEIRARIGPRTGNNRSGERKYTGGEEEGSCSPGSSLEETKERSRFNASNVGRDKLSKHFSRYYQTLWADLPHVLRRVSAAAPSPFLSPSSHLYIFPIWLFVFSTYKEINSCYSAYLFTLLSTLFEIIISRHN